MSHIEFIFYLNDPIDWIAMFIQPATASWVLGCSRRRKVKWWDLFQIISAAEQITKLDLQSM